MAAKIVAMLEHRELAQTMAARARDVVKEGFGLSLVVAQQAALYRDLVNDGGSGRGKIIAARAIPAPV
jgi:hypothetical protein